MFGQKKAPVTPNNTAEEAKPAESKKRAEPTKSPEKVEPSPEKADTKKRLKRNVEEPESPMKAESPKKVVEEESKTRQETLISRQMKQVSPAELKPLDKLKKPSDAEFCPRKDAPHNQGQPMPF